MLILLYAIVCNAKVIKPLNDKKSVGFDDVIGRNIFGASGFSGTWISPTEFTYNTGGNLTLFDMTSNSSSVLLTSDFSVKIN